MRIAFLSATLILSCLLSFFIINGKVPDILTDNVEALSQKEDIIIITCIYEKDSICISEIEGYVRINAYFSPH